MTQPTNYTPTTDFSQQESINASGRSTVNTAALDAEFANIETTLDQTVSNLALLQRDDGRLKDLSVDVYTLTRQVLNLIGGFALRGAWATATTYAAKDIVDNAGVLYVCSVAHTSPGAFVELPNWMRFGFSGGEDAAASAALAAVSAANADISEVNALAAAAAAAASAAASNTARAAAVAAQVTAASSSGSASASATNAANSAAAAALSAASVARPIPVAEGGTGATSAAAGLAALGGLSAATLAASSGASLVGFIQSGAGSVARTMQDKAREVVSVADKGAVGDGVVSAVSALSNASASAGSVLVTPGTYLIDADLDISGASIIVQRGASFTVSTGKTLTLGVVDAGLFQIFSGDGSVVFKRQAKTIYPEWFGAAVSASLTNDVPAIHKAVAAATANLVEIAFYGEYGLGEQLTLSAFPCYTASRTAEFQPFGGYANGPILSGSNWHGKTTLPRISGFTGFGLKLFGSRVADVYVPIISSCGDGLVLEGQIAASGQDKVLDCKVTVGQIGIVSRGIVFKSDSENCVFQGNEIYVNFISAFSVAALDWETSGTATPHDWDSNKVQIQATDPLPNTGVTVIRGPSAAGVQVDRWKISVETWCGGLDSTSKFISGNFNDLSLFINTAINPVIDQIQVIGTNNKLDFNDMDGAANSAIACMNAGSTRATFNAGVPLWKRRVKLSATLPADVDTGGLRSFYFYHQCTDRRLQFAILPGELSLGYNGFLPELVRDNSASVDDEVFVSFRNISGALKAGGTVINFYAEMSV